VVGKDCRKGVQTEHSIIGQASCILIVFLPLRYMILKKMAMKCYQYCTGVNTQALQIFIAITWWQEAVRWEMQ